MNTNHVKINNDLIDKCFDFMTGNARINGVKSDGFPNVLLEGNEKQKEVIKLIEKEGLTTREIGELLNVSAMAVSHRYTAYLKGRSFYSEWILFWNFIAPIRNKRILELFDEWKIGKSLTVKEKQIIGRFVANCDKKNIVLVGDLLFVYASKTQREARSVISITHKDYIFSIIKEFAENLLNE